MGNSLREFMDAFLKEHTLATEGEMVLAVLPEELEQLGLFFVRGMCGWALGLRTARQCCHLVEVTEQIKQMDEVTEFDFGNGNDDEELIH